MHAKLGGGRQPGPLRLPFHPRRWGVPNGSWRQERAGTTAGPRGGHSSFVSDSALNCPFPIRLDLAHVEEALVFLKGSWIDGGDFSVLGICPNQIHCQEWTG